MDKIHPHHKATLLSRFQTSPAKTDNAAEETQKNVQNYENKNEIQKPKKTPVK